MSIETPAPAAQVRHALAALELAAIQHRRIVRRRLRVGEEELSALLYLAHHGGVLQRHLARVTSLSRSGAGAMVQRLEERGYVQRRTDPADRRLRLVELSPDGRALIEREYREFTATLDRLVADEQPAQVAALGQLLAGLAGTAEPVDETARLSAVEDADAGAPIWRAWG